MYPLRLRGEQVVRLTRPCQVDDPELEFLKEWPQIDPEDEEAVGLLNAEPMLPPANRESMLANVPAFLVKV